jgi:hypothetical protein
MEHELLENRERLRYLESTNAVREARNAGEIRSFSPTLHPRSQDHIIFLDKPREWFGTGGWVVVIGWCLSHSQERIRGIRAAVAGDQPVEANVGLPRPDVAEAFPDHPFSKQSGFTLHAPWKADRGPLRIEVCHHAGTWSHLADLVCEYRSD